MIYIIDGSNFSSVEEFWQEIETVFARAVSDIGAFGKNFSALRDVLSILPNDAVIIWKNSKLSLKRLGHAETIKLLQKTQKKCHPSWNEMINKEIELAQYNLGETIFDVVVKIFVEEGILLRLE
jgi:RNAse (barnase) inhibitor barstar